MAYSSNLDLLNEMAPEELAKLSGSPGGGLIDPDRTDYARSNADALIDAYLWGRYPVPFEAPIDPLIKRISCDLTMVYLYEYAYQGSIVPSSILQRKLLAIAMLKDLQRGKISLMGYTNGSNAPAVIICNKDSDDRLFFKNLLEEYIAEY